MPVAASGACIGRAPGEAMEAIIQRQMMPSLLLKWVARAGRFAWIRLACSPCSHYCPSYPTHLNGSWECCTQSLAPYCSLSRLVDAASRARSRSVVPLLSYRRASYPTLSASASLLLHPEHPPYSDPSPSETQSTPGQSRGRVERVCSGTRAIAPSRWSSCMPPHPLSLLIVVVVVALLALSR